MNTEPGRQYSAEFKNRAEELGRVLEHIRGGTGAVLVVAMPTMGKSRFLGKVPEVLKADPELTGVWEAAEPIDLRDDALASTHSNLSLLLAALFPGHDWSLGPSELAAKVARLIRDSGKSRLVLLDGADLLTDSVARKLRSLLSDVNAGLEREAGGVRIAFIASSSSDIDAFLGIYPSPGFQKLLLPHFKVKVVAEAIREEAEQRGLKHPVARYEALGRAVWEATGGLPPLLERTLGWLGENEFALIEEADERARAVLIQTIVRPYVESTLLRLEVLLPPQVLERIASADRGAMESACMELVLSTSACRLVTRSHLQLLAGNTAAHPQLQGALDAIVKVGMQPYELFGKLSAVEPGEELWHELYTGVRRLYFQHRYPAPAQQVIAHHEARAIYERWQEGISSVDLARFHLERFWHEVEIVRCSMTTGVDFPAQLRRKYLELVEGTSGRSRETLQRLFGADQELRDALEAVAPGLFAELLAERGAL